MTKFYFFASLHTQLLRLMKLYKRHNLQEYDFFILN